MKTLDSQYITELIAGHDTAAMLQGVRYYRSKSDIVNRKMHYYNAAGQKQEDTEKENHKLVNNWHRLLVDQKVSYLVGKPVVFQNADEEYAKKIELLLGEEWDDTLADLATNASNKGAEWLHVYIDQQGYFKYIIVSCEAVIPIYDSAQKKNLEAVLYYYPVMVEDKARYRVEWWTREDVSVYIENASGEFILDSSEKENPSPHYKKNGKGFGWTKVPFIEFPNNSMRAGDLETIKSLVDEYDLAISDFANNNAEIQEIIMILKGYESTSLAEFRQNLRFYKTIKIRGGNDTGVEKIEMNIPVEAKKELLDRLEENIFIFGQGVNSKTDHLGNSPSGDALEFLYTLLDLKASMMERKFRRAIKRMLWFTTEYINMEFKKNYDSTTVQVKFRKNMIQNTKEIISTLKDSRDMISDETIVALHPLIEDPAGEYQRLLQQRSSEAQRVSLEDVDLIE